MFVRPRGPRRTSRFRSGRLRTEREKREHLISVYMASSVKLALFVALALASVQAFRAAQIHASATSLALRLFMPLVLLAGGLIALRSGIRGLRDAEEVRQTPILGPDEDD